MIKIKSKNQMELPGLETWRVQYTPVKLTRLEKSWAGVFRTCVLPVLPIKKVLKYYTSDLGRPSKELYSVMGATILQQFFNLTDEETIEELAFNQLWHFALECFNENDQVISLKTLWTMRNRMVIQGIGNEVFEKATDLMIKQLNVNTDKQRLDSVHVYSNMAKLGRIRVLSKTTELFLKALKKNFTDIYDSKIHQELKDLYFKGKGISVFGQVKPSDSEKTLQKLAEEMNGLLLMFVENEEISSSKSFKLLERVFSEHCIVKDNIVIIKKPKEVECTSIQNPSDQDAGYDGHKGQGYQTQIVETYSEEKEGEEKPLNLITYVKTESAAIHDSHALIPALDNLKDRDICPKNMLGDASYGGHKNIIAAKEKEVEVISPVLGNASQRGLDDFHFDKGNFKVLTCPANHKPDQFKTGKNDSYCAKWSHVICNKCPLKETCTSKKGKNNRVLHYKKSEVASCLRRIYEQSDEYKEKYRYRSGIEGTNSRFISQTEARKSRYRNLDKMSYSQSLKALFINLFRVTKSKVWEKHLLLLIIILEKICFPELKNEKCNKYSVYYSFCA